MKDKALTSKYIQVYIYMCCFLETVIKCDQRTVVVCGCWGQLFKAQSNISQL